MNEQSGADLRGRKVVVLLAKMGVAAPPRAEMEAMAAETASRVGCPTRYAFTEQGEPALRTVMLELVDTGVAEIAVVPLTVPAEPNLMTWVAKATRRWQRQSGREWPTVRLGSAPLAGRVEVQALVAELAREALDGEPVVYAQDEKQEGTLVPAQKRRVLVCHGAPCHNAGAAAIWGHLRNEAQRLDLRNRGEGVMSAKTSCLGPCALAPVLQVFPSGTYYGGVDEAGIDRIIAEDLTGGRVVDDLAYAPTGKKHRLRAV